MLGGMKSGESCIVFLFRFGYKCAADYLIELLIFLQGGKNMMPRAGQKKVRINTEG